MFKIKTSVILGFTLLVAAGSCLVGALEIPLGKGQGRGGGITVGYVDMEAIFQEYPETQKAKDEYYKELDDRRQALAERDKELSDLREQLVVLRTTMMELDSPALPVESSTTVPAGISTAPAPSTHTFSSAPASGVPPAWGSETGRPPKDAIPTAPAQPARQDGASIMAAELGVSTASVYALKESLLQREKMLKEQEKALEEERGRAVQDMKDLETKRSLQIFGKLYKALVQLSEEKGISLVVDKSSILYGQTALDLTDALRRRIRGLPDPEQE